MADTHAPKGMGGKKSQSGKKEVPLTHSGAKRKLEKRENVVNAPISSKRLKTSKFLKDDRKNQGKGQKSVNRKLPGGKSKEKKQSKNQRNRSNSGKQTSADKELQQKNPGKGLSLIDKMKARLQGSQFRMLNEKLYTCRGDEAFQFFKQEPQSFVKYHSGYKEQTSHWPTMPVDVIIEWLKRMDVNLVVADFGCGDAKLAASVSNKVFSLDLVSSNPDVIQCNMAKTPLKTASVDVAVFCLSLMGTDYQTFLFEANRVLKFKGWLIVAEVKSRFDPSNGGADPDDFVQSLTQLGFQLKKKDLSNKMFLLFHFSKEKSQEVKDIDLESMEWPALKACMYKKR